VSRVLGLCCRQGMDWMLGLLTTLTYSSSLRVIERHRWSPRFTVHRYALGFSVVSWQRILIPYLYKSYCNCSTYEAFFSQQHSCISSQSSSSAVSRCSFITSVGLGSSLYSLGVDPTENTVYIITVPQYLDCCLFVAAGTCLSSRCLAKNVQSLSTIPAFRRNVTIVI
jgi:hypothetical protein